MLAKYAKDGFAIMAAVPSCALMFKQEIQLMFPDCADTKLVKEAMWDPFEYFMARKRDGLLKTEFPQKLGNVSYQIPCHGRVQNIGKKTEEMLKMIPDTEINTIERCSGHAGTRVKGWFSSGAPRPLTSKPWAMWWPPSGQSELMKSGLEPSFMVAMALNTGLPIFIAISCEPFLTP